MEQATENNHDWSGLPEDLVVTIMHSMHVAGAIRSAAVCASWHAAYTAFRRLRVPSPRQPPCLLYAIDDDGLSPGAAALHCPATGATLRVPFPRAPLSNRPLLGSAHGWLVTADEVSNLHLLNPITGDQIALPPITAMHHVKMGTDENGDPAYNVYENQPGDTYNHLLGQFEVDTGPTILDIDRAHLWMYHRVVLSASPAAGGACVVLILHMPFGEVSFARLGDDRWTWVTGLPWEDDYRDAIYSAANGLFYLLQNDGSMCSLDLNGPSPVACKVLSSLPNSGVPTTKYLVQTPAGDILQVWRYKDEVESPVQVDIPPEYNEVEQEPCLEYDTTDLHIYKVDLHGHRAELIKSLPDYALFLGFNGSMCLLAKDFPGLKRNCAYITDDFFEYVNWRKYNRREVGIWSMAEQSMSKLVDVSPVIYPWLTWPSPIWKNVSYDSVFRGALSRVTLGKEFVEDFLRFVVCL
ncbi:hypothetical protein HU200_038906 [Digitaria exilis]|uniref:KIB1-4 beta-propeller domain-containing protein n=1 Tax=Digitaria exilis TaxID=1010633 RepID=A0A835EFZ5_9POAL|nr:hypothetical protein HU200_038906 [Digitaria exilis]